MTNIAYITGRIASKSARALTILSVPLLLVGCAGSQIGSRLLGDDAVPIDRQAVTEEMFQTCRRETIPWMSRPTSPMAGKCECAAVSFHNYATDTEYQEVKNLWIVYGNSKEFTHKVLGVTENFHATHCATMRDGKDMLQLTRLDDNSKLELEKAALEDNAVTSVALPTTAALPASAESVEMSTEPNTIASADGVTRFSLSPSATKDKDIVRYVQRKLKGLGFNPGPLDGVVGARTLKALGEYAQRQQMPSGTSTEDIMSSLLF